MADDYFTDKYPKILYKYRDLDNELHLQILRQGRFYFANMQELNDPFDMCLYPQFDNIPLSEHIDSIYDKKEYLLKMAKEPGVDFDSLAILQICRADPQKAFEFMKKMYMNRFHRCRICSFSTDIWNSRLMWSHYSNNHQGFNIGLDYNKLMSYLVYNKYSKVRGGVFFYNNVIYSNEYPVIKFRVGDILGNTDDVELMDKMLQTHLCVKNTDWSYEKEFRLIIYDNDQKTIKIHPSIISEVNLGSNSNPEKIDLVKKILKNKNSNIPLYKLHKEKYGFNFERERIEY